MSTPVVAILHYGANERRAIMLEKLGGKKVLREAIDKFYEKQINDPRLMCFFYGVNVEIIKWHQFNLMSIAFTEIPENFDLKELLLIRHQRLFDEGLNETHFDLVAQHFSDTLREMNVDPKLRDEALEVVMPLRDVFAQGVREAQGRAESATRKRQVILALAVAFFAVGVVTFVRLKRN
jgi:hemoglobin